MKNYLTIAEAAKEVGVSEVTIKRYLKSELIISYKIGGRRLIDIKDLDSFKHATKHNEILTQLEEGLSISSRQEFKYLVNFSENLNLSKHRWFNIKEGYSEELVLKLIERFQVTEGYIIDPFLGSGTTAIAASKKNLNFVGFEVNPFLAFLSKVKLTAKSENIEFNYLQDIINIQSFKNIGQPKLSIIEKLFNENLNKILTYREYINNIEDIDNQNFYKAVLLCSLDKSSYAKKDGNGLKYPKNKKVTDFTDSFIDKFNEMYEDSSATFDISKKSMLFNIDSRNIKKILQNNTIFENTDIIYDKKINVIKNLKNKAKLAIFSPPYMNCFDYTEVYKTELWVGQFINEYDDLKTLRNNSLSSHLNKSYVTDKINYNAYSNYFSDLIETKGVWDKKIPFMINEYFSDMHELLVGMFLLLEKGGKCIIVVGNSAYSSIAIPTDLILAKIGRKIGFQKAEIEIARNLGTSSQQYKSIDNIEILRESLVILTK